jgi:hypothetical protein
MNATLELDVAEEQDIFRGDGSGRVAKIEIRSRNLSSAGAAIRISEDELEGVTM